MLRRLFKGCWKYLHSSVSIIKDHLVFVFEKEAPPLGHEGEDRQGAAALLQSNCRLAQCKMEVLSLFNQY